jgi:hypothetical protein
VQQYPQGAQIARVKAAIQAARYETFTAALKAKNVDVAARIANEAMGAGDPEFGYVYSLSAAAGSDLLASTTNSPMVGRAGDWASKAIAFVESGKMPAGANQAEWDKAKPSTLNLLYRVKGHDTMLRAAKKGAAATAADYAAATADLEKAIQQNPQDILAHYFLGQSHHFQYATHAAELEKITDQETPEAKAVLDKLNASADKVIESWAKVMQLAGTDPQKQTLKSAVQPTVVELYKYRHPETPDGWQTLVNSAAQPATAAAGDGK